MLQLFKAIESRNPEMSRDALRQLGNYPNAREDAIELINHLRTKERTNVGRLFRGVEADDVYHKELSSLKPGSTFELPVSSFSKDEQTALIHGTSFRGKTPYIFVLEGPVRNIDTHGISLVPSEAEVLVKDRFRVKSISRDEIQGRNRIFIEAQ